MSLHPKSYQVLALQPSKLGSASTSSIAIASARIIAGIEVEDVFLIRNLISIEIGGLILDQVTHVAVEGRIIISILGCVIRKEPSSVVVAMVAITEIIDKVKSVDSVGAEVFNDVGENVEKLIPRIGSAGGIDRADLVDSSLPELLETHTSCGCET